MKMGLLMNFNSLLVLLARITLSDKALTSVT